ncbi:hypothetical protein K440DRAFT_209839 [Wilcoxina mikolae CBS 423.85]|nr:hypothetical protein K440DRAFT_209839 [Wilcoxina mikolae CBS 423.85]
MGWVHLIGRCLILPVHYVVPFFIFFYFAYTSILTTSIGLLGMDLSLRLVFLCSINFLLLYWRWVFSFLLWWVGVCDAM